MTSTLDGVAVISLDSPPVNALGVAVRERLERDLQAAQQDPRVRAIVITGAGKAFSAGADIKEFGSEASAREPTLRSLIMRIEASSKPVVAAISGLALGGGLELAMACHGRVVQAAARVGLPEVTLGLIPGAGGTQRLPRLIGIDAALDMMLQGRVVEARSLAQTRLFDAVEPGDPVEPASRLSIGLADKGAPLPLASSGALDASAVQAAVDTRRTRLSARQRLQPAFAALLDAVGACALPSSQGMLRERELFLALVPTPPASALRYQFLAEREAMKPPRDVQASARKVRSVAVIGAGTMGTGIAIAALDAGLSVLLLEQDDAALARGEQRILEHYQERVATGKLDPARGAANRARLSVTTDWTQLRQSDLVIEAVFEDLAVKQQVFRQIDAHARPGAVLATNTSYLDVDDIASATTRPSDVLGLHFFSPANVMKLLEVVRAKHTAGDVLATGVALGAALKKTPVITGNAFGFIGNRIYNAYRRQCEFMLEDGAWPEDIDNALVALGFAMGPFAVADLSGLDIAWRMRRAQAAKRDARERYVAILDHLCELGRLGRKSGAGYYTYSEGKASRTTDEVVRSVIMRASEERGIQRRSFQPVDVQRRALVAMVNEALLLLAEGVAVRASDVDVVMVQGYGFPRWEGGPLYWASQQNRERLAADLTQLARDSGYGFVAGDLALLDRHCRL